jgi:hypothetical protein
MNKIVTLTRDMRPWSKGQDAVLPKAMAEKLVADGDADNLRSFPPSDVAPRVPVAAASLPARKGYMTRKRG